MSLVSAYIGILWAIWAGKQSCFQIAQGVNNGRGPVDFKLSQGSKDATLVEFKMARTLKRNLEKQVDVYKNANRNPPAIKAIVFFTDEEMEKVYKILNDLGLTGKPGIVVIDARKNNKIQASKA